LSHVGKIYRMGEIEVPVLYDVNLEIPAGELTVIVGPSGSGKSTLLNLIGGIDRPTTGEILLDGRDIARFSDSELTAYRRESVGFVFQFYNLVPTLTARENVMVSTEISRDGLDPAEALRMVGLEHRLDHFPSQM
jgi:putative ABC transport system ATP-binding protein